MSFAVVQFVIDETYSEVPLSWLTTDRRYCFWPSKAKNTFSLMKKGTTPDATWDKFEIKVEGIYSSLKQARRKAENTESTTEDDDLGKGRRKRIRSVKFSQDSYSSEEGSDYDERDSSTPPPKLSKNSSTRDSSGTQNMHSSTVTHSSTDTLPSIVVLSSIDVPSSTDPHSSHSRIKTINPLNITDNIINSAEIMFENVSETIKVGGDQIPVPVQPVVPHLTEINTSNVLDKLLQLYSSTELLLKSMDERLRSIESRLLPTTSVEADVDLQMILDMLPLETIESLESFEAILTTNEIKSKFIQYLNSIGGHHLKDNIHRMLKRTFTNKLGVLCSWLGLRNNYKVCTLGIIRIIKVIILRNYTTKEKEVEDIISEWFRLSKLRMHRQKE